MKRVLKKKQPVLHCVPAQQGACKPPVLQICTEKKEETFSVTSLEVTRIVERQ